MKFKLASFLGLIVPLSIALMLTAFLGCGGGGTYGGPQAYDGTWSLNLKGYAIPAAVAPVTSVTCTEAVSTGGLTTIVIAHGFGTVTEEIDCYDQNNALLTGFPKGIDISITLTPDATGNTGTVKVQTTGGGTAGGICIDRVSCSATSLMMIKCGEVAAHC